MTFFIMQMTAAGERLDRARLEGDIRGMRTELGTMTRLVEMRFGRRDQSASEAATTSAT